MLKRQGQNGRLSRRHNLALALKLIIQSRSVSRKELADRMGLTQAALTKISEKLIALGLVREGGGEGSREGRRIGRRPIPLSVDPDRFRILTLHIGRQRLQAFLTDAGAGIARRGGVSSRRILASRSGANAAVLEYARRLIDEWGIDKSKAFAVAISAPGPVKAANRRPPPVRDRRYHQPYLWDDLRGFVAEGLGCPVFAENDSNLMALAEQWFGSGQNCRHFVVYDIGEGIGAAAIIDDRLFRGHNNVVAEIGHSTVNFEGEQCSCGNRGCLELYAGFGRLREKYLALRGRARTGSFADDLSELFARAAEGDAGCGRLLRGHADIVAAGAVSLANLFSPEKIVVASFEGDWVDLELFAGAMRESVRRRAFSAIESDIAVEPSALGADIMAYGGTALVMSELFSGE